MMLPVIVNSYNLARFHQNLLENKLLLFFPRKYFHYFFHNFCGKPDFIVLVDLEKFQL